MMGNGDRQLKAPFVKVSKARNIAFVQGDETLAKMACLYYEHVIVSASSVPAESRETISALNHSGVRFVEVSSGDPVLRFFAGPNDWRNTDQFPDEEGLPGLRHIISPSRYGFGPDYFSADASDGDDHPGEITVIEDIGPSGGTKNCLMIAPPQHHFGDVAFVQRYSASTTTHLVGHRDETPGIALSNIDVIDLSHIDWPTLAELRRDERLVRGMQAIRLFVRDSYEGRSLAYVEDHLGQLILNQRERAKAHGLNTKIGILIDLLEAKDLQVAAGVSLASLLFGAGTVEHLLQLVSAGATVAMGSARIALSAVKRGRETGGDAHGATYLIGVADKVQSFAESGGIAPKAVDSQQLPSVK